MCRAATYMTSVRGCVADCCLDKLYELNAALGKPAGVFRSGATCSIPDFAIAEFQLEVSVEVSVLTRILIFIWKLVWKLVH